MNIRQSLRHTFHYHYFLNKESFCLCLSIFFVRYLCALSNRIYIWLSFPSAWSIKQIYVWVVSVPPGPRPFAWCSHQPPPPPLLFFWKVQKHLGCSGFENRATPKTIRAGGREMCVENSQGAETPRATQIQFPPLWLPKTKEFHKKIRAGPHPKPTLMLLPPPPSLSMSLTHTCTHYMAMCTHTNTQQSNGDFMQPSMRHTFSLVIQHCWLSYLWRGDKERGCVCVCGGGEGR